MNKQELNSVFESLEPTEEQKKRMFANIMSQKAVAVHKVINWHKIYIPACAVAAAAFIFAVYTGGFVTNNVAENHSYIAYNNPAQTDNVTEGSAVLEETDAQPRKTAQADKETLKNKSASETKITNDINYVIEKASENKIEEPQVISEEVTSLALNINTASTALRSRSAGAAAAASDETKGMQAYDGEQPAYDYDDAVSSGGGSAVSTITYDEFCTYINTDIRSSLELPDDMTDTTDSERSVYGADEDMQWDVVYRGSDNRIITINISTDTVENMQYFENDSFIKTDINGNTAVVIYDGESYTVYMSKSGIAYNVMTNITEQELAALLASIL